MSPKGRTPDPERKERGTGHRKAAGEGVAIEGPIVQQHVSGAGPPDGLSPIACELWQICIADMATLGHLREPDLLLLRGYCETAGVMIEAAACIQEFGSMMKQPIVAKSKETDEYEVVGYKLQANPAVKQHGEALNRLRLLSNELALNPLARIRGNLLEVATSSIALDVVTTLSKKLDALDAKAKKKRAK